MRTLFSVQDAYSTPALVKGSMESLGVTQPVVTHVQDTTPPVAFFNATLPANGSAAQTALLSWDAGDASAVAYTCRLGLQGGSAAQAPVQALQAAGPLPGPPLALGAWQPCTPPLQLYWLLPGLGLSLLCAVAFPLR